MSSFRSIAPGRHTGDQPSLDYGGNRNPDREGFAAFGKFPAFGKVVKGMNVVRALQRLPGHDQMLVTPLEIQRMERKDN